MKLRTECKKKSLSQTSSPQKLGWGFTHWQVKLISILWEQKEGFVGGIRHIFLGKKHKEHRNNPNMCLEFVGMNHNRWESHVDYTWVVLCLAVEFSKKEFVTGWQTTVIKSLKINFGRGCTDETVGSMKKWRIWNIWQLQYFQVRNSQDVELQGGTPSGDNPLNPKASSIQLTRNNHN